MLALQAGPQAEGHAAAAARGEILTGPAPGIRNKALFGDFVVCQVKVQPNFLSQIDRRLCHYLHFY